MNSSMAGRYPRRDSEGRLLRTGDFAWSKLGRFGTCFVEDLRWRACSPRFMIWGLHVSAVEDVRGFVALKWELKDMLLRANEESLIKLGGCWPAGRGRESTDLGASTSRPREQAACSLVGFLVGRRSSGCYSRISRTVGAAGAGRALKAGDVVVGAFQRRPDEDPARRALSTELPSSSNSLSRSLNFLTSSGLATGPLGSRLSGSSRTWRRTLSSWSLRAGRPPPRDVQ